MAGVEKSVTASLIRAGRGALTFILFWSTLGSAQDRPDEGDIFGSSQAPEANAPAADEKSESIQKSRDAKELGASDPGRDAFASGEVTDNPLQIGGILYQRMIFSPQQGVAAGSTAISMPLQLDAFMDARPNEHIRAYIGPRLMYDPTRDAYSNASSGSALGNTQTSSSSAAPTSLVSSSTVAIPNNPTVVLDKAWLNFDIARSVFLTIGKQRLRWGPSRYWNPTDFLNTQRRDPLLPYDLRLGNSMLKVHVPWESKSSNFYAVALFDNPLPASTLGQIGGAFRAETLVGPAEVGIEAVYRNGLTPTYGMDLSTPVGPLDFYLEASYRAGYNVPNYQMVSSFSTGADLSSVFTQAEFSAPLIQVTGGLSYSFAWKESRQATVGMEYFYNQLGYDTASIYPVLIFLKQYQPFYTGRNYAAIYVTAEGPDEGKRTSYTFSTLGNLSDMSFISRIDFSWRVLTYLSFESYIGLHYGTPGGEFRFSMNTPVMTYQGSVIPALSVPAALFDLGLGLRVSI